MTYDDSAKFGMTGKGSHRKWTPEEDEALRRAYGQNINDQIPELSASLSRSYAGIYCRANELRLCQPRGKYARGDKTRSNCSLAQKHRWKVNPPEFSAADYMVGKPNGFLGKKHSDEYRKRASDRAKQWIAKNGHPRGMKGKHHSMETCMRISKFHSGKRIPESQIRQRLITKHKNGTFAPNWKTSRSWKAGWRTIGGQRIYARSRWEANYARYLEFLKSCGEVISWEHEPDIFWFNPIKRGVRSYVPDFKVWLKNGAIEYHEVKGWMDDRSKTKLKRMKKYHSSVTLRLIDSSWFSHNRPKLRWIIKDWENAN